MWSNDKHIIDCEERKSFRRGNSRNRKIPIRLEKSVWQINTGKIKKSRD